MGRPRKPDKKVALSFRATPQLAADLDRLALALGSTMSEAVEQALAYFIEHGFAQRLASARDADRAAALAELDADAAVRTALRRLKPEARRYLRRHLDGETYRDMSRDSDISAAQVREIVREARSQMGETYRRLLAKPELLHAVSRLPQPSRNLGH